MTRLDTLPEHVATAYLQRLGCDAKPPSAAELARLHAAHVERVPYETTWLHLGERRTVDPGQSAAAIALRGRGGYCFHLNGAFGALLGTLGYQVEPWIGGVHADAVDLADRGNHLVLVVSGLADTDPQATGTDSWYVDVGLGDALHGPLPLRPATVVQGPLAFRLERLDQPDACWRFVHDPGGAFGSMSFARPAPDVEWFAPHHARLSTDPASPFVRRVTVQRRTDDGVEAVVGRHWRRRSASGLDEHDIDDRDEWFALVSERLLLDLSGLPMSARDRLWRATQSPS